jgi:predicted Zn-dependent protease
MSVRIDAFLAMLDKGQDSAMLRFSLGNEYLAAGDPQAAVPHLRAAVATDPEYSAAWKLLGKALAEAGDTDGAAAAYADGIKVAEAKGDRQAAKEMGVFLKRLQRGAGTA